MKSRLIVGLGNPGVEYEKTRHNLGFMLIDKVANEAGIKVSRKECSSFVGRGELEGCDVQLVKPQTYMNLSGEAVRCLLAKHKLAEPGENLIVISDDLALPFGKIRIRCRGSAGEHNGLKSIIRAIGTGEFVRLRIGIQPEHRVADARSFVLDPFPHSAVAAVDDVLQKSSDAIHVLLGEGIDKAMAQFN